MLVQKGLLDGPRAASALSGRPAKSAGFVAEVFDCLVVESWARMWSGLATTGTPVPPGGQRHELVTNSW
jgi:hypothetical protein